MSSIPARDRVSLCRYSYADQRQCRTPRSPHHAHFCYFHARRESQSIAVDELADNLSYFFSGKCISANDLCAALGRLIPAVVRGDIKPRTASTIAYLAQTFIQAIQVAEKEYTYTFGTTEWAAEIRHNVSCNLDRINEADADTDTEEHEEDDQTDQSASRNAESPEPDQDQTENSTEPSAEAAPLVGAQLYPERGRGNAAPHLSENSDANCSGGSSDPCSCIGESSDSDEDADQDPDEQFDSDNSAPNPEPLTPVEATLAKN